MRGKLLLLVLSAVSAMFAIAYSALPASAHDAHPGLNFWIAVDGVPNCSTQNANSSCDLTPGSTFGLSVHLDPLPGDLPDYAGMDISLQLGGGLTGNHDANNDSWPDCAFPAASYDDTPGRVVFGCAIGVDAGPSSYTGVIGSMSFGCASSGSIELTHSGESHTDLLDNLIQSHSEPNTVDSLTVNCVQGGVEPPTPTPAAARTPIGAGDVTPLEPTAAAIATSTAQSQATATARAAGTPVTRTATGTPGGTNAGNNGDDGLGTGAIIAIIVGGVAAALAVAGGAWWYMQNRAAAGGGPPPATGTGGAPPAT